MRDAAGFRPSARCEATLESPQPTGLAPGATARHEFAKGRHGWLQVARGAVDVNGVALAQGDGLAISDERSLAVTARENAEVLLFDLA